MGRARRWKSIGLVVILFLALRPSLTNAVASDSDPNANQGYGSNDPYANDYKTKIMNDYTTSRTSFLQEVTAIYFARGCKVINNPNFIEDAWSQPLIASAQANGIIDNDIAWLTTKAENTGLTRAKQHGACDYFHQHPDVVYEFRQEELRDTLAWSASHGQ